MSGIGPITAPVSRNLLGVGLLFPQTILADPALLGYWRGGETVGTVARDEIRKNHGTYVGPPTLNQAGALIGDLNPSVGLSGSGQYVTVAGYNDLGGDMTALAIVKSSSVSVQVAMGGLKAAGGAVGDFYLGTLGDTLVLNVQDPTGFKTGENTSHLVGGAWHLVAGVVSGLDVIASLDGVTGTTHGTLTVPRAARGTSWLALGTWGVKHDYPWNGGAQEWAILGRALSAAELLDLWKMARAL